MALLLLLVVAAMTVPAAILLPSLLKPRNWGVVEPGGLYRSGIIATWQVRRALADHKVQVVITLIGEDVGDPQQRALVEATGELGIRLQRFPMPGNGIPKKEGASRYADAVAAIARARQAGKVVLVQCYAGAQRTGGVIACYEMLVLHREPADAYRHMLEHRWSADKNGDLLVFVNSVMPEVAARLVEMGIIKQIPQPIPVLQAPAEDN